MNIQPLRKHILKNYTTLRHDCLNPETTTYKNYQLLSHGNCVCAALYELSRIYIRYISEYIRSSDIEFENGRF